MNVLVGKSYHISDAFFTLVNDSNLMTNKDGGRYRPHFFFFADPTTQGIFWAIPQSSKVAKYRKIIQEKQAKYGKCNTIVIGSFGGKDSAFLIQNMFPVIAKYVDHEHTIAGVSVNVHAGLTKKIISNAKAVLSLHKRGYKIIYPDVNRIYNIMLNELSK
ncbi:MAG: hypothetical protein IJB32_03290 [Clostridia bacterium]|nr:hypothetical protein [Clostridia bacterium]